MTSLVFTEAQKTANTVASEAIHARYESDFQMPNAGWTQDVQLFLFFYIIF